MVLLVGYGSPSIFFENWEQYLTAMNKPQVWASELEMEALAFKFNCPIVLLSVNTKTKIYNPDGKNGPIFLHHPEANYFEACIPFKGLTPNDVYQVIKNQEHS